MTPGEALKAALSEAALDPKSTPDEKRWLGNLTYHLTGATAARIAAAAAAGCVGEPPEPEPMQCPECGMGRPGHVGNCARAPVATLGPRT